MRRLDETSSAARQETKKTLGKGCQNKSAKQIKQATGLNCDSVAKSSHSLLCTFQNKERVCVRTHVHVHSCFACTCCPIWDVRLSVSQ